MLVSFLISVAFVSLVAITVFVIHLIGVVNIFMKEYNKFEDYKNEVIPYYDEILQKKGKKTYKFRIFINKVSDVSDSVGELSSITSIPFIIKSTKILKKHNKWIEDNLDQVPYVKEIADQRKHIDREEIIDKIINDG